MIRVKTTIPDKLEEMIEALSIPYDITIEPSNIDLSDCDCDEEFDTGFTIVTLIRLNGCGWCADECGIQKYPTGRVYNTIASGWCVFLNNEYNYYDSLKDAINTVMEYECELSIASMVD